MILKLKLIFHFILILKLIFIWNYCNRNRRLGELLLRLWSRTKRPHPRRPRHRRRLSFRGSTHRRKSTRPPRPQHHHRSRTRPSAKLPPRHCGDSTRRRTTLGTGKCRGLQRPRGLGPSRHWSWDRRRHKWCSRRGSLSSNGGRTGHCRKLL